MAAAAVQDAAIVQAFERRTGAKPFDHDTESARAARAAHTLLVDHARSGRFPAIHVYYTTGRIEAFDEDNDPTVVSRAWTLAWPEAVPGNLSSDQLVNYFRNRTGALPYLPVDDALKFQCPKCFARFATLEPAEACNKSHGRKSLKAIRGVK